MERRVYPAQGQAYPALGQAYPALGQAYPALGQVRLGSAECMRKAFNVNSCADARELRCALVLAPLRSV